MIRRMVKSAARCATCSSVQNATARISLGSQGDSVQQRRIEDTTVEDQADGVVPAAPRRQPVGEQEPAGLQQHSELLGGLAAHAEARRLTGLRRPRRGGPSPACRSTGTAGSARRGSRTSSWAMARLRGRVALSSSRNPSGSLIGGSETSRPSSTCASRPARCGCDVRTRTTPSRRSPTREARRRERRSLGRSAPRDGTDHGRRTRGEPATAARGWRARSRRTRHTAAR